VFGSQRARVDATVRTAATRSYSGFYSFRLPKVIARTSDTLERLDMLRVCQYTSVFERPDILLCGTAVVGTKVNEERS
jgi:hypothetical protein